MDILAIASIGMQADLARMESISQNSANALTPGFKRQISVTPSFSVEMAAAQHGRGPRVMHSQSAPNSVSLDSSTGAFRPTGNVNDVAIEGAGFFEVTTSDGPAYTKIGNFRIDVQGRLVTGNGLPVMSTTGELRLTNSPFSIEPNGNVQQGGRIAGRIKIVTLDAPESLISAGSGLYLAGGAKPQEAKEGISLRIGFLEGSNVNTPQEMVRLTETVRHFEAMQRLVQGYDETMEKTIRKLGEF